jgi:hypothetical protein
MDVMMNGIAADAQLARHPPYVRTDHIGEQRGAMNQVCAEAGIERLISVSPEAALRLP